MTPNRLIGDRKTLAGRNYQYSDFDISWAGEDGLTQGFCFGSEDGRLRFTGRPWDGVPVATSGEAINGVAFSKDVMGISTRSEVIFFRASRHSPGKVDLVVYNGGAHGIISTYSGQFIAPQGTHGLLLMNPTPGESQPIKVFGAEGRDFYFYKVARAGLNEGAEALVCALRRGGWASYVSKGSTGCFSVFSGPDLDVVDVCSVRTDSFPRAAIALGIDRSLHFMKDVTASGPGMTLHLNGLRGTAYRILSVGRDLILLTSESLYTLTDLVDRCLRGDGFTGPESVWCIDLHAVDASVVHDHNLLIVRPDGGVTEVEVADLAGTGGHALNMTVKPVAHPEWASPPRYAPAFAVAS
jgi:hypothetical protein